jgi:hypothetical protein
MAYLHCVGDRTLKNDDKFYNKEFEDIRNNTKFDRIQKWNIDNIWASRVILSDKRCEPKHKRVKRYICSHNVAVAFMRTHGYPTLYRINHDLTFNLIPMKQNLHKSLPIHFDRISCITLDTIKVQDQHFFRISRRVTIPDFCFNMAIFVLESDKIKIKQNKNKIELYVGFPNIMKNDIKTCTYINALNWQFKYYFTDIEFTEWTNKCMSRTIDILTGDNELREKFASYYCIDTNCSGYNGFISCINTTETTNKYVSCIYCRKDICTKCFKLDHGLSDCNITHDEMTEQTIANSTKKCPSCFLSTEKSEGCNHIQCRCNTHWCWGCNIKLNSNDPYHHNGTICPNHLLTDMNVWRPDIPLPI